MKNRKSHKIHSSRQREEDVTWHAAECGLVHIENIIEAKCAPYTERNQMQTDANNSMT